MSQIKMDADDVRITEINVYACDQCEEAPATHHVLIDCRNIGSCTSIGRYCLPCANEVRDRIAASLPPRYRCANCLNEDDNFSVSRTCNGCGLVTEG